MYGSDIVLSNGGGTVNLSTLPGQPNEFIVSGSATLTAGWTIQLNPALTAKQWDKFILSYKAVVDLNGEDISIFGTTLTKEQAAKKSTIICIYDGAAWIVNILMDSSDLPSAVTGSTATVLTAVGGTITLVPKTHTVYQKITGSAVLAGNWVITAGGTPKAGDEFYVHYKATMTLGVNAITIFGMALSAPQASGGDCLVYAKYDGASWIAILIEGRAGKASMWEDGSAGTESCTRINSTTGCDATGNYSVSSGYNALASGAVSQAHGNAVQATGIDSWSSGNSSVASATRSTAMGNGCTASGQGSMAVNDLSIASGAHSFACNSTTQAQGEDSFSSGDHTIAKEARSISEGNCSTSPYEGSRAWSSGRFSIQADSQEVRIELKGITTDGTPTNLQGPDGTDGIEIPTDCSANISIRAIGVQTAGAAGAIGDTFMQNIELCVKNIAGTLTIDHAYGDTVVGVQTKISDVIYKDTHGTLSTSTSIAVSVGGTKLQITPTGTVDRTIRWKADVSMSWIGYRNFTV